MFTEGARHLTWGSRRERDNEGGDSSARNKLSTCGVAVGEQSQIAGRDWVTWAVFGNLVTIVSMTPTVADPSRTSRGIFLLWTKRLQIRRDQGCRREEIE